MGVSGTTNVDVDLVEPTMLRTSEGVSTVSTVHFSTDNPAAAVRARLEQAAAKGLDRSR